MQELVALLLFYVGAIFLINGVHLLGLMSPKECGWWNIIIAIFMFANVINFFRLGEVFFVAQVLLFAFTYLFLGINLLKDLDMRGLGWYCLWVALVTPFVAKVNFDAGDLRFGLIWIIWGITWFTFWLILGLGFTRITRGVALAMIPIGVFTAWVPGLTMFLGVW